MDLAGPAVELIGEHPLIRRLSDLFRRLGPLRDPVLLVGERGIGKHAAARAIHAASTRVPNPFVAVACEGVPADKLEAELFGIEQDSFAGGVLARSGKIHRAGGGTLFLRELGDLPLLLQERLLAWLERRKDIRIIAATQRDLADERDRGVLRAELYDLFQISITMPSLRERRSDIPLLVRHLVARHEQRSGRKSTVSEAALIHLWEYDWPGNIAELETVLEQALVSSIDGVIEVDNLPAPVRSFMATKKVRLSRQPAMASVPPLARPTAGPGRAT